MSSQPLPHGLENGREDENSTEQRALSSVGEKAGRRDLREEDFAPHLSLALRKSALPAHDFIPLDLWPSLIQKQAVSETVRYDHAVTEEFFRNSRLKKYYNSIEPILLRALELPEVQRLDGCIQATCAFTLRGASLNHTRLAHSASDVLARVVDLADRCGLSQREVIVLGVAGIFHDVGHSPFSHLGEEVLVSLGEKARTALGLPSEGSGAFHEQIGAQRVTGSSIGSLLREFGIDPEEVAQIITDEHPLHTILDHADRAAYLIRDGIRAEMDPRKKMSWVKTLKALYDQSRYENGSLQVPYPQLVQTVLNHRQNLFMEFTRHPATLLANEILKEGILEAISQGRLSIEEFAEGTDCAVIEKLSPEVRPLFDREAADNSIEQGIEHHFSTVVAWQARSLQDEAPLYQPHFLRLLREAVTQKTGCSQVYAVLPDHTKKSVEVSVRGSVKPVRLESELPEDRKVFALFAADKPDVNIAEAREVARKVLFDAGVVSPRSEELDLDLFADGLRERRDISIARNDR